MTDRSDEVFLFKANKLDPLPQRPMRTGLFGKTLEEALQTIFEKYPQVIPGKQIDPDSEDPPRFVLLRREMPLGSWSLDHLFVDQRGVLTLLETKLIQNPESRREVVGQIIEYAAGANEFWGRGRARQSATEYWSKQNKELDEVIQKQFGQELDIETFWSSIETNLRNGRIRLIIATDELRPEVRRMIEYLNREMQNAEVLGVELRCYGEEDESLVLVPRLVGQTQASIDQKSPTKRPVRWPIDDLRTAYEGFSNKELGSRLEKVLNWAVENNVFIETTAISPSFGLRGRKKERLISFFPHGEIYVYINEKHYVDGTEERDRLVADLKNLRMLDQDLDPQAVVSGRNLVRRLFELSDDEVDQLLAMLSKYCS